MAEKRPDQFEFSLAKPVKVGVLMDLVLPTPGTHDVRQDTLDGLRMGFDEAFARGILPRPVELAYREVDGLPRGNALEIREATRQLVEDEGCLIVFGPATSESSYPVRQYLEEAKVPAIAWAGTDDFLGEWTFSMSLGSLPDEPIQLANVIAGHGHRTVAVVYERYKVGNEDLRWFRQGCDYVGLEIVKEIPFSPGMRNEDIANSLKEASPDALVSLVRQLVGRTGGQSLDFTTAIEGVGLGDVPRYVTSQWTNGWLDDETFNRYRGWIGLEQWDEENLLGVAVLDRFEKRFGRRPGYSVPMYAWDVAQVISRAIGNAYPLTPEGVKLGLEQIKLLPAASGSPGTCISFGKWTRRGWMGAGYMVARTARPGPEIKTQFSGRMEPWSGKNHNSIRSSQAE